MTVYVAERHMPYEGFDILGIFATRAEAQARCDETQVADDTDYWSYEITEHVLGAVAA